MATPVDARTLKSWLHQPGELALLDVREAGRFGESHLLYAVPLPYSRLEFDIGRLVPRLATRIVLCDGGEDGLAALAARRLAAQGYSEVHVLDGGTKGWHGAGFKLFAGVNVPSKAFGEIVEHELHTPRITAAELNAMIERGDNMVIVDGRPFAEYQKMNIPGGICCPNGELPIRIGAIAPDPATRIVVNCAGRTRSIMGAETLRLMGVPNPVFALENGTQGWFLAGLQLEHKSQRKYPTAPSQTALLAQRSRAADRGGTGRAMGRGPEPDDVPVRHSHGGGVRGRQPARRRPCAGRPARAKHRPMGRHTRRPHAARRQRRRARRADGDLASADGSRRQRAG
jgi:rhodanese-related sulfurtransferase